MSHNDTEDSMKLTSEYRREASELVTSLSDGADGLAASLQQCLGRNSLADASQEPVSLDIPSTFTYCHACGNLLRPGKNGTTLRLRSVGRGKTRRRRASRRRAAEFRSKKQASVGGGRKWRGDDGSRMNDEKEERDFLRVTDGSCRNMVVVTCGSCGWKLKHKGLPAERQQAVKAKEVPKNPKSIKAKEVPKNPTSSPPNGLGDIVTLPNTPVGGKTGKRSRKAQRHVSSKKTKSSGLLDFLSSLND